MALSQQDSLNKYGTVAYTGWGEVEAQADWNSKHSSSTNTPTGGADSILQQAVNSFLPLVQKVAPYESANPFSFDEALARQASTAEYAPYYKELLTDYTSNVERTKSRSAEDLKTTLEQLNAGKEYYTGVQRRALDTAVRNTNEGYAGRGLFFSGVRGRDVKELQTENQAQVGNYLSNYGYNTAQAKTSEQRTGENLDTALSQYTRDQNRAEKAAIEGGVLQRKGEALNEYGIKEKNYYDAAFGTYA
jgi:hypothetical protein